MDSEAECGIVWRGEYGGVRRSVASVAECGLAWRNVSECVGV